MDAKLSTTIELKNKIKVTYFELTKKGIIIDYTLNNNDCIFEANPLQSCSLLKEAGFINRFSPSKDGITVSFDAELNNCDQSGNHVQQSLTHTCTFEEYVLETSFTQSDALNIAALHARRNQNNYVVEQTNKLWKHKTHAA